MEELPTEIHTVILSYLGGHDMQACMKLWPELSWCVEEDYLWFHALRTDGYMCPNDKPAGCTWYKLWCAMEKGWSQVNSSKISADHHSSMIISPVMNKFAMSALTSPGHPEGQQLVVTYCNYFQLFVQYVTLPDFFDCICMSNTHVIVYQSAHRNAILLSLDDIEHDCVTEPDFNIELERSRRRTVHLTRTYVVITVLGNLGTLNIFSYQLNFIDLGKQFIYSLGGVSQPHIEALEAHDILVVADGSRGISILKLTPNSAEVLRRIPSPAQMLQCVDDTIIYSIDEEPRPLRILEQQYYSDEPSIETSLVNRILPDNSRLNVQTYHRYCTEEESLFVCATNQTPWRVSLRKSKIGNILCETSLQDFQGFVLTSCAHLILVGNRRFRAHSLHQTSFAEEPRPLDYLVRDLLANSRLIVILIEDYSYCVYDVLHQKFIDVTSSLKEEVTRL